MTGGGTGTDPWRFSSGDYCNYYQIPGLDASDPNNVSQYTGFSPPDNQDYQIFNGEGAGPSACQANGNTWGWYINSPSGNGGMQHSVSFGDSGTTLFPWASSFGDPSLVLRSGYYLGSYTFNPCPNCGAGWKYLCALLMDTSTTQRLEYCLNEWSTYGPGDDPTPTVFSTLGQNLGYNGFANVQTNIDYSSDRAYISPGSATTQLGSGTIGTYHVWQAGINTSNLGAAINAVNNKIVAKVASGNTNVPLPYSTDVTKYALIGLEDGHEFWGGMTSLGGYSDQLQAWTAY